MATTLRPDVLLVDEFGRPIAAIETRTSRSLIGKQGQESAIEYAKLIGAQFALLVTPRRALLWRLPMVNEDKGRSWVIDTASLLAKVFDELGFDAETVSAEAFGDVVAFWLRDLGYLLRSEQHLPPTLAWLADSGLDESLRDGYIRQEVAFEAVR